MQNIIHIIRNELSGMFTKNVVDEVVRKIEKALGGNENRETREKAYCKTKETYDAVAS